jgi:DNA repair protein RadC
VPHLAFLKFKRKECFVEISLSSCNGILGIHVVTEGLADRTQVHAREVFAEAIRDRASGVILAHNHPSGALIASDEDKQVTRLLARAGKLLEIPVLDHLIVSFRGYTSLRREFPELFET